MKFSLQQISDRLEIEDLLVEYADAIDSLELDRLDQVFTADAFIDYSAMGGAKGDYAEVKAFLQQALPAFKSTQHMMSNYQIRLGIDNPDKASGKIMCFNPMQLDLGQGKEASNVFFLGLWYIDEYIRTDKGWRIARRSEIKSYDHNTPDFVSLG